MIVLVVASSASGYLAASLVTLHETHTTTIITTSDITVSCMVSAESIGVALRVLEGNSPQPATPVTDATVSGYDVGYCNNSPQAIIINSTKTNSTGWADLRYGGYGTYYLSVQVSTISYSLAVAVQPVSLAYVTFDISSGNTTTSQCEFC
jgi:hypothetical protein